MPSRTQCTMAAWSRRLHRVRHPTYACAAAIFAFFGELICVPVVIFKTTEFFAMPSKNERVELEMQIMRYRQFASRTTDEEFLKRINAHIAEMELKLREIDE